MDNAKIKLGWQCPCCRMVWAPWVKFCDCQSKSLTITNLPPVPQTTLELRPEHIYRPELEPYYSSGIPDYITTCTTPETARGTYGEVKNNGIHTNVIN